MIFKLAHFWRDPVPHEIREHQLLHAELGLLEAQEKLELYASQAAMFQTRIERLRKDMPTVHQLHTIPPQSAKETQP